MAVLLWGIALFFSLLSLLFGALAGDLGTVGFSARLANTVACLAMLRLELMERGAR